MKPDARTKEREELERLHRLVDRPWHIISIPPRPDSGDYIIYRSQPNPGESPDAPQLSLWIYNDPQERGVLWRGQNLHAGMRFALTHMAGNFHPIRYSAAESDYTNRMSVIRWRLIWSEKGSR